MPKAVICMAKTQTQAQIIIDRLEHAGIEPDDVSIVMSDHSSRFGFPPNSENLLRLLKGVGRIVIAGAGFFVAAGPLLKAIQDSPQSTSAGVAGALIHFGLPEHEASRHQELVQLGAILIAFHTSNNDEAQRIREILENTDGEDISVIGEEDLADMDIYKSSRNS